MEPFELLHRAVDALREAPGIRHWRRRRFEARFAHYQNAQLFRGVFANAADAIASAPGNRPIGCDNEASANLPVRFVTEARPYDYPAFFWLRDALAGGMRTVADLGGSVGMKYFALASLVELPHDLRWRVVEVPAMVAVGRRFAAGRGAPATLEFTERYADIAGVDVLYASGSLQYIERSLGELLLDYDDKPRRIVVNQLPIHAERSYFTLNGMDTAYCAYRVDSRADFTQALAAHGYRLRDAWKNPEKKLELPFDPGYSLDHYMGFCFDR